MFAWLRRWLVGDCPDCLKPCQDCSRELANWRLLRYDRLVCDQCKEKSDMSGDPIPATVVGEQLDDVQKTATWLAEHNKQLSVWINSLLECAADAATHIEAGNVQAAYDALMRGLEGGNG